MLHNNQSLFEQVILRVSEDTSIEASIIEKDYYVTLFLQQIVAQLPNIIFKGGLSHDFSHRLSERTFDRRDSCLYQSISLQTDAGVQPDL